MAITITRKKILIAALVLILILGGVIAYIFVTGQLSQQNDTTGTSGNTNMTGNAYQERLTKVQTEVTDLVAVGDEASIQEADQILNTEIETAKKSGNISYIVDASNAKATLLINTDRAPEALEALLALEQQYGDDDDYKYELYGMISWAYREIDDQVKADEYFNKIPSQGWDD
jgi:multidrug efflux pump subunit AcrB